MNDKNLNEWLFADIDDLIDCNYSDESETENRMTDKEIVIEKTFSEELPYFKERIKEVFDNYNNPNGNEDPLYICVLRDSDNIVRKAEEEITRQKTEIDDLKHEREVLIEDIHHFVDKNNEQLEEIEKLERTISYLEGVCESTPDKIRAEAVKEFAYRLKQKSEYYENGQGWEGRICYEDDIDSLVKEMVGEE